MIHSQQNQQHSTSMDTNPYFSHFQQHADYLNAFNERRERLVKASRDVTQASKKAIFDLHRLNDRNRGMIIKRAHKTLANIRSTIAKQIAKDLPMEQYYRYRPAFTPGLQEYIESRTFLDYLENRKLMSLDDITAEIATACTIINTNPLHITSDDYILGIADLTGELMRRAVADASGEGVQILLFMRLLSHQLESVSTKSNIGGREMRQKMDVFRRSLKKVEKACFDIRIRRAELPDHDVNIMQANQKRQKLNLSHS